MPSSSYTNASLPPEKENTSTTDSFTVCCEDRWQVYYRLVELDIRCQCGGFQLLKANIETATEAIQLWSIVRRVSQPRLVLAAALERSWKQPCGMIRHYN